MDINNFNPTAAQCLKVFNQSVKDYHQWDDLERPIDNPFEPKSFEFFLYQKNWIDTVQWHYEDVIRDPKINPCDGMELKRKIDTSNQDRTDMVERIDDWFMTAFENNADASKPLNTETPAWVLDRMSILCLKIWHMEEQTKREDMSSDFINKTKQKLAVLLEQKEDLSLAFDALMNDFKSGAKRMKVYRQMKMYNDPDTNPFLKG